MAQINIYEDCSSEKPSKTYTCHHILTKHVNQFVKLIEEMDGKSYADQIAEITKIVRTIFPQMTDDEVECMDVAELKPFFSEIVNLAQGKLKQAQKN